MYYYVLISDWQSQFAYTEKCAQLQGDVIKKKGDILTERTLLRGMKTINSFLREFIPTRKFRYEYF